MKILIEYRGGRWFVVWAFGGGREFRRDFAFRSEMLGWLGKTTEGVGSVWGSGK